MACAASWFSPTARRIRPARVRSRNQATSATMAKREIDQDVLAEEQLAEDRQVAEAGDVEAREGRRRQAAVGLAPISADRPRPKIVSARPVATWLASSVSVRTPKSSAIDGARRASRPPAPAATLPVAMWRRSRRRRRSIIMPSTPRLRTPDFSTTSSPMAAKSSGVAAIMALIRMLASRSIALDAPSSGPAPAAAGGLAGGARGGRSALRGSR